ncbi:MAG: hypothetical protein ACK411_14075 [Exiguobacterium mexicanum]
MMGDVDDRFVEESMEVEVKKRRHWRWMGGLIAAAAVTLFVVTWDGCELLTTYSLRELKWELLGKTVL